MTKYCHDHYALLQLNVLLKERNPQGFNFICYIFSGVSHYYYNASCIRPIFYGSVLAGVQISISLYVDNMVDMACWFFSEVLPGAAAATF